MPPFPPVPYRHRTSGHFVQKFPHTPFSHVFSMQQTFVKLRFSPERHRKLSAENLSRRFFESLDCLPFEILSQPFYGKRHFFLSFYLPLTRLIFLNCFLRFGVHDRIGLGVCRILVNKRDNHVVKQYQTAPRLGIGYMGKLLFGKS